MTMPAALRTARRLSIRAAGQPLGRSIAPAHGFGPVRVVDARSP
jgi:hypothetical protein